MQFLRTSLGKEPDHAFGIGKRMPSPLCPPIAEWGVACFALAAISAVMPESMTQILRRRPTHSLFQRDSPYAPTSRRFDRRNSEQRCPSLKLCYIRTRRVPWALGSWASPCRRRAGRAAIRRCVPTIIATIIILRPDHRGLPKGARLSHPQFRVDHAVQQLPRCTR